MRDEPPSEGLPARVLARYAAGESDERERARVEAWASLSGERRAYIAALEREWARSRAGASDSELRETGAAWGALSARLGEVGMPPGAPRQPVIHFPGAARSTPRRSALRFAAAAAVVAASAAGTMYLSRSSAAPPVVVARQSPMREVVTGTGERARVTLGDGSTVVLGARSRLGIPADFGERARELEAEGEAYFKVAHDSTRPFVVHAGGTRTTDIGTAFVIRAYPDDPRVRVIVAEGSVSFEADGPRASATPAAPGAPTAPRTLLRRGQMGRFDAGADAPMVATVDPATYTAWMDGRLAFDNAPLPEVIADLGRWHTTRIVLADSSLARETVTASLAADSFDEALRTLTTVLALRAEHRGSTVVLHRRREARR